MVAALDEDKDGKDAKDEDDEDMDEDVDVPPARGSS